MGYELIKCLSSYSIELDEVLMLDVKLINLQLLEATARSIQPVLEWGESGFAVTDGLSNLLKVLSRLRPYYSGDIYL